ncbi:Aldo/keto reductase [Venturia nashicola]|uniref:Aldo/keto reductase n=1 Tax=Venturia nashicola TaxID=86259 RepID=A0A4Z1NJK8_9PEZI|nr:Aldo/keto reductase [Venturia nashicola]
MCPRRSSRPLISASFALPVMSTRSTSILSTPPVISHPPWRWHILPCLSVPRLRSTKPTFLHKHQLILMRSSLHPSSFNHFSHSKNDAMTRVFHDIVARCAVLLKSTPPNSFGQTSLDVDPAFEDILARDEAGETFNFYSPTGRAGGLLASTPSSRYQEHNPGIANWIGMYKGKSKLDEGVDSVRRWAVHDSPLRKSDGIVLGARSKGQLVQNLERIKKGGLPDGVKEILDEIWDHVKIVAPGLV